MIKQQSIKSTYVQQKSQVQPSLRSNGNGFSKLHRDFSLESESKHQDEDDDDRFNMLELKDQWNQEYTNNYGTKGGNNGNNGVYSKQSSKKSNYMKGSGLKSNSRQTKGFMKSKDSSFGMVGFKSEDQSMQSIVMQNNNKRL